MLTGAQFRVQTLFTFAIKTLCEMFDLFRIRYFAKMPFALPFSCLNSSGTRYRKIFFLKNNLKGGIVVVECTVKYVCYIYGTSLSKDVKITEVITI